MRLWSILFLAATIFTGCCGDSLHIVNVPAIQRCEIKRDEGNILIGIAVSGGGSRAAVFASNILEFLWKMTPPEDLDGILLLDEVDYFSSCSGGSLSSLYYCLKRPEKLEQKFFDRFVADSEENFEIVSWCDWLRIVLLQSYRTVLLADIWDEMFFEKKTFGDLCTREEDGVCPRLIMNATSISHGTRFLFTNLHLDFVEKKSIPEDFMDFDDLASDISSYPLSYALVASAAMPGMFLPITLADYSTPQREYIHLVDGGVGDNLSSLILLQIFRHRLEQEPGLRGALLILIDVSQPFDTSSRKYSDFNDYNWLEATATVAQSFSLLLTRNSDTIKEEMRSLARQNPRFGLVELRLAPDIASEITTRWQLENRHKTVLREEAAVTVANAASQIWEFVRKYRREVDRLPENVLR